MDINIDSPPPTAYFPQSPQSIITSPPPTYPTPPSVPLPYIHPQQVYQATTPVVSPDSLPIYQPFNQTVVSRKNSLALSSLPKPQEDQTNGSLGKYGHEMAGMMEASRKGSDVGLGFEHVELIDTLGTGTFGKVFLVGIHPPEYQSSQVFYYAMKVLDKESVVRLKQVEHINQERSILGRVNNPFTVNLFCTFQDEKNVYMLLDFIQGGELFYHLRRSGRFTPDVARFYASNILLGIEYLHERDIIYRDLKPENLLLDEHGYIKITDFGFAKKVEDRTFTLCGTPEYLAPEIIQATGHGKAADWWAFGILLFEMLCGWPPFYDSSPFAVYDKVLNSAPAFPPWIDAKAKDLISRLLTHDRSKRLGNLERGAQDVKDHPWFHGVDFSAVEQRLIAAPIVPPARSRTDTANFEKYQPTPISELPGMSRAYAKGRGQPIPPVVHEDVYRDLFLMF